MIIRGADFQTLESALDYANQFFQGNLTWMADTPTPSPGGGIRCRIRVREYDKPGWRLSFNRGIKRIPNACWHAVGHFLDGLPKGVSVFFDARTSNGPTKTWHTGDGWDDWLYGISLMMSEMCNCGEKNQDD